MNVTSCAAASLPAGVSLERAEDRRADHRERDERADQHPQGAKTDRENKGSGSNVHDSEGSR